MKLFTIHLLWFPMLLLSQNLQSGNFLGTLCHIQPGAVCEIGLPPVSCQQTNIMGVGRRLVQLEYIRRLEKGSECFENTSRSRWSLDILYLNRLSKPNNQLMDSKENKFPTKNTFSQKSWSSWDRTPPVFWFGSSKSHHLNKPTILELIGNSASIAQPQQARLNQQDLNQNEKNLDLQKLKSKVFVLNILPWICFTSFYDTLLLHSRYKPNLTRKK